MTIYLDIVLIENLCMNYIILFATGYIMKVKSRHIRMIISSTFGRNLCNFIIYANNSYLFKYVCKNSFINLYDIYSFCSKKYQSITKVFGYVLFSIVCIWRLCVCIVVFYKTRRYIYDKWSVCRNISC